VDATIVTHAMGAYVATILYLGGGILLDSFNAEAQKIFKLIRFDNMFVNNKEDERG